MEVTFDGRDYRIRFPGTPPIADLTFVRSLPFREFDSTQNNWRVEHVTENEALLRERGVLPIDAPPATRHATSVSATVGGATLLLRVPGTPANIDLCRGIPDAKTWVQKSNGWRVKASRRNIEYIQRGWPNITWTDEARKIASSSEAPMVESKADLERLKDIARGEYTFLTAPFEHQLAAFALSRHVQSYGLFMEPGTGKTFVDVNTAGWLFERGLITGALVVCPKSIKSNWAAEIEKHLPPRIKRRVVVFNSGKTNPMVAAMGDRVDTLDFLVMNIDALVTVRGWETATRFIEVHETKMTVDESSRIKNTSAKRTKACIKLGKMAKYRRVLTGTPVTQSPLDVFAQFQFLDANILGFGSYYSFRNRFTVMGGWQNKQILRYVNLDELQGLVQPYSYRVTKAECLDLPEKIYQKIGVDLTPTQREVYNKLRDDMEAEIAGVGTMTATIALTLLLRFQQIVGGFFPVTHRTVPCQVCGGTGVGLSVIGADPLNHCDECAGTGAVIEDATAGAPAQPLPGGNPKLEALIDFIEDRPGKIIIWSRFRGEIEIISRSLREKYGDNSVVEFHGGVNDDGRKEAIGRFQGWSVGGDDPACRFFVGQTETGGMGITLTAAHDVVYYSNSFSLESRLQSEDRAHRIGQVNHVTYTDIVASKTIDDKLLDVLRKKMNLANFVTGDNLRDWL